MSVNSDDLPYLGPWAPMGGTELMMERLKAGLDPELLENYQILPSRISSLDESKIRLHWIHDLPKDALSDHLANGGWRKFYKLIFVSNWQMQAYIRHFDIPWSKCLVIPNAIEPIGPHSKPKDKLRLIYTPTPHRGLGILIHVFKALAEKYDFIHLDVYSSFKLYDLAYMDEKFQTLFDQCREHPNITYHGTVSNAEIREALKQAHIFAYPCIWEETSCLTLMEAMSAGLLCVHPNLGGLYETSANWTMRYQWQEDVGVHATLFQLFLESAILNFWEPEVQTKLEGQVAYCDRFYNWDDRLMQWDALLRGWLNVDRSMPPDDPPEQAPSHGLKHFLEGLTRPFRST